MVAISVFNPGTKLRPQFVLGLSTAVRDLDTVKLPVNLGKSLESVTVVRNFKP